MTPRELEILQGTLDVLVLRALSWGPKHGYAVARFIREGSREAFKVLDGALYTSLHRMEGYARPSGEPSNPRWWQQPPSAGTPIPVE